MKRLFPFLIVFLLCSPAWATDPLLTSSCLSYKGAFSLASSGYFSLAPVWNAAGNGGAGSLFVGGYMGTGWQFGEISIPTLYTGTAWTDFSSAGVNNSSHLATILQSFQDVSGGAYTDTGTGGAVCGTATWYMFSGGYISGSNLYYTYTDLGDNSGCAQLSVAKHSTTLSASTYQGMWGFNFSPSLPAGTPAGMADGGMTPVPSAYQSQLGGDMLITCNEVHMNGAASSSAGPCISSYYLSDLTAPRVNTNNVPLHWLVGYPAANAPTNTPLGSYNNTTVQWNYHYYSGADHYVGLIFPSGTRSVLVFGLHGTGHPGLVCNSGNGYSGPPGPGKGGYCHGTSVCSEICFNDGVTSPQCTSPFTCNGVSLSDGTCCAYDPDNSGTYGQESIHAPTAWPWYNYVWAYDVGNPDGTNTTGNSPSNSVCTANLQPLPCCTGSNAGTCSSSTPNNLTAVKNGTVSPWQIIPYAVWSLSNQFGQDADGFSRFNYYWGAAYDSVGQNLYFPIYEGQGGGTGLPVVEVFGLTAGSGGTTPTSHAGTMKGGIFK